MASYTGTGEIVISGSSITKVVEPYLLNFTTFSRNRDYNAGLDENNKYPEEYAENYSDLFSK